MTTNKRIEIIKQTKMDMNDSFSNLLPGNETTNNMLTVHFCETYDFTNKSHRRDLFSHVINEAYVKSGFNSNIYDKILKELQEVIQEAKDELPFH